MHASIALYYADLMVSRSLYIKPEQWEWSFTLTAPLNQPRPRTKPQKMAYNLREQSLKNYKELEKVDLPRVQRVKAADPTALYQVEVLQRENKRVKVH